jgi:hypothetical protein
LPSLSQDFYCSIFFSLGTLIEQLASFNMIPR